MNSALYYSNYCNSCKKLLQILGKSKSQRVNYICIDNRLVQDNKTYIILQDGSKLLLPSMITKVPTLIVAENNNILTGNQIYQHLQPKEHMQANIPDLKNEPDNCALLSDTLNKFGVASDTFSFLDQSGDDLLAKGEGGLRQMYNYSSLNDQDRISAPNEDYKPDKVGTINLGQLEEQRNKDIGITNQMKSMPNTV